MIHGTNEHTCQAGTGPLEIYCWANPENPEIPDKIYNKHLVVVTGANHFGYTDGICLDPNQQRVDPCINDILGLLPQADGWDNPSEVGDLEEQEAQALQQRVAGNYLQAFFSNYLQGDEDALDYLIQKNEGEEQCGHPGDRDGCMNDLLFDPPSGCEPKSYFDDLQSLNVEVSVCSCTE